MAVKKIEELNIHRDVNSTEQFDVQGYLNENWDKMQDVVDDNAEELMQVQKDISTLKEDNKTNKSSIDVLEKSNETRDGKISKNTEDIEAIQGSIKTATETINKKDNEQDEDIKANKESIKEIQAENERLREDIKSIAIVGEENGESIHIEDSSDARCELEIGGNQKQDTREGYNILPYPFTDTTFQANGIKYTDLEDGSVNVNGTNTGYSGFALVKNMNFKAGTYTFYGTPNTNVDENSFRIRLGDADNNDKLIGVVGNVPITLTFDKEMNINVILQVLAEKEITISNVVWKPMIILGADINKKYEQYGASPSLDFPSELKAVGDDINILNDTIFARKGYYSGIVGATTQKANTTIRLLTDEDINVISNKDITISLGTDKDLKYNVFEIDENDVIIKNNMSSNNKDKTIKLQENTKKISLMLMWQDANKTITLEDIKDCKIKIAYGTRISNYSSYNCGSAKIDIFNKNFIDIDKLKSLNSRNAYEKYNNVECLKLAGVTQRYNLNCKQNTQYVFQVDIVGYTYTSKLIGQFLIAYTDGSTSYMQTDGTNAGKYSLISKAGKTVKALVWNGYSSGHFAYIDKNDIQLDEATTLTNIVQHEEQSYLVDVQQEMLKGDTFVRKDGKWYEKHCVKTEIMLTFPTTNIEVCGTFANFQINRNIAFAVVKNDLKITNVRNDILCDKLKAKDNSMWGGKEDGIQTYINSNKFMISIPFEDIEKNFGEELTINNYSQAFRKYINDNGPFKIYYLLEEPELVECTEAQNKVLDEIYNKAHTYKNITNISAESVEVNPTLNIKYLKDAETEHNKLQAQIDEIKQLLSSTETSAMLLNNMQTDLESEV